MASSSSSSYDYLMKKYIELNFIDGYGNRKISNKAMWNPYIYPDNGYIPPCGVCKHNYDEYVTLAPNYSKEISWPHYRFGCLWAEYYEDKLKNLNKEIKFVRK